MKIILFTFKRRSGLTNRWIHFTPFHPVVSNYKYCILVSSVW